MRLFSKWAVLSVVMLVLSGCNGGDAPSPPSEGEMTSGEMVFRLNCAVCHEVRPGGFRSLTDLTAGSKNFTSRDAFIAFLRHPDPPDMPAFRPEELSDEDVTALYDWLKLETGN